MALSSTGLLFALRGNTMAARYATGRATFTAYRLTGSYPSVVSNGAANVFGGMAIDMNDSTASYVMYNDYKNLPTTGQFSALMRVVPKVSANATSTFFNNALFFFAAGPVGHGHVRVYFSSSGILVVQILNQHGSGQTFVDGTGSFTTTTDVPFDIMLVFDGTTGGNNIRVSINGVERVTFTSTSSWDMNDATMASLWQGLVVGGSTGNVTSQMEVNEFLLWDTIQDHVYTTRTDFFSTTAFVGAQSTDPGVSNVLSGTGYTFEGSSQTGTYHDADYTDPGIANVLSGTSYVFNDSTLTGTLTDDYSNPGVANVRKDTNYIFAGSTLTGTLNVPTAITGSASTVNVANIKEQIRFVLAEANTTTGSPIDISANMSKSVKTIYKINPELIEMTGDKFPAVTVWTDNQAIEAATIANSQSQGKRKGTITFTIAGIVWNDLYGVDLATDPADEDLEKLMNNIERILRSFTTLTDTIKWQLPNSIQYFTSGIDEEAHMRVGLMTLECHLFY